MSALYGEYPCTMDPKSRVFVPARFREALAAEKKDYLMLSLGLDSCIFMFLPSKWEELLNNNMEIFKGENKEEERAFKRAFFGSACEAQLDRQGRILVPQNQKEYASLSREVMVRGVGNKAEIWDARLWKEYTKKIMNPSFAKFSKIIDI
jgi:MraZ protein